MQLLYAAYLDGIGARAGNTCAAGVEEVCNIYYMRLSCRVLDDGKSVALCSGENNIYRSADGGDIKIYIAAAESAERICLDIAALDIDGRAECFKAPDMLIYRANAEIAPAGVSDISAAESADLCADKVIGGAHLTHKLK